VTDKLSFAEARLASECRCSGSEVVDQREQSGGHCVVVSGMEDQVWQVSVLTYIESAPSENQSQ
jgi:hypothetical protein